jgi:hypothetical protein
MGKLKPLPKRKLFKFLRKTVLRKLGKENTSLSRKEKQMEEF